MDKMKIYNESRAVPEEAQKPIKGGRIGGMTNIEPMWRIKILTEMFGPCGDGWIYKITDKQMQTGANGEIAAFVDIELRYRIPSDTDAVVWSDAIPGTGGSMFVAKEKNGMHTSDECYKMALTDAISVACKSLGVGADIYYGNDPTKYDRAAESEPQRQAAPKKQPEPKADPPPKCEACGGEIVPKKGMSMATYVAKSQELTGKVMCPSCGKKCA